MALEMGGKQYSENIEVRAFDCDMTKRIALSPVLKYMEEIADKHCTENGFSYDVLLNDGVVFLLTSVQLKFHRIPKLREKMTVTTWQRCIKGVQFIRDTEFLDEEGNLLIEATCGWILADPVNHKIKRPTDYRMGEVVLSQPEKELFGSGRVKISIPENAQKVATRRVVFTDIDYNNHLNNTRYADIISDFVPDLGEKVEICELDLVFAGEAYLNEDIEIFRTKTEDDTYIINGTHSRGRCFESRVKVRDIKK